MNPSRQSHLRALLAVSFAIVTVAGCGGGGEGGQASEPVVLASQVPNVVSTWHDVASNTINVAATATGTAEEQRPTLAVDMATVHVAIYDAVMAIVGTHQPYAAVPSISASGASVDAAATAAAYWVLAGLFPNRSSQYQTPYDEGLAKIPDGDAKTRGIAIGKDVATRILALRANDGRAVQLPAFVPGTAPGQFRGTNPINTYVPYIKPFALTSAAQFRAPGPPALGSTVYASDFNETKVMAATGSTARSAQQTEIAQFHTEAPARFQARNYRQFAMSQASVADNARLAAQVWVTVADTTIACFEAKYHYRFWRPTSAITLADTDGNAATEQDAGWTPHVATPNHPEYPAAHSCAAGAISGALSRHFGTRRVTFSMNSTVTNTVHAYESTDAFVSESAVARIWGGMHFRTSTEHGLTLGQSVANWVADHHFRRN
jgi:hypothetical protein